MNAQDFLDEISSDEMPVIDIEVKQKLTEDEQADRNITKVCKEMKQNAHQKTKGEELRAVKAAPNVPSNSQESTREVQA